MASPQKENGYTAIANELYDALTKWHLSSYEFRVLIFLLRKTYGWNKKKDWISLSQFVEGTKIRESHVSRTLNLLMKQNMITKGGNRRQPEWGIQKDFDRWAKLPKGVRSHHKLKKGVIEITKGGKSNVSKGGDTKDTLTKDNVTKDILAAEAAEDGKIISEVIKAFEPVNPSVGILYARPPQRQAVTRLLKQYGYDQLLKIIQFLPKSNASRYGPTITTPCQLEENMGRLKAFAEKQKQQITNNRGFVS